MFSLCTVTILLPLALFPHVMSLNTDAKTCRQLVEEYDALHATYLSGLDTSSGHGKQWKGVLDQASERFERLKIALGPNKQPFSEPCKELGCKYIMVHFIDRLSPMRVHQTGSMYKLHWEEMIQAAERNQYCILLCSFGAPEQLYDPDVVAEYKLPRLPPNQCPP